MRRHNQINKIAEIRESMSLEHPTLFREYGGRRY